MGTIQEHFLETTIYCYISIGWILIGNEILNGLFNILFLIK